MTPARAAQALLLIAILMELLLLFGWLRPMALWEHGANPPEGAPMVALLGRTRAGALRFAVPAALLSVLYALAVWLALRARGRLATVLALAAPVVFAATLVPMFPGGTQDIFHNIADGRLLWRYGENPTLVPPLAHPEDAFFPYLFGYVDLTSAYGPLWYVLVGVPVALAGDGFAANLVAQKLMMAGVLLATVLAVWAAVRRTPRATAAAVVVGWCPLLLWETAGNGHNDVIMVFFATLAVIAAVRRWWLWVFPLLALSALVKFTTLLLGPVLLVWMLRRDDVPRRTLAAGLGIALLLAGLMYAPFWAGADTFGVLARPGMSFILSPATLLNGVLVATAGAGTAARLTQVVTGTLFALLYLVALVRLRGTARSLTEAGFDGLFAYLVLASWWFWPWYLTWLGPLAAWGVGGRRAWVFVLATGAALLTYCYWWSDPPEQSRLWFFWYSLLTAGVFAAPFALWLPALLPAGRVRPRAPAAS